MRKPSDGGLQVLPILQGPQTTIASNSISSTIGCVSREWRQFDRVAVATWSIDQVPRTDPLWKPVWDRETRERRLVCPGCGHKLITAWTGDNAHSWKRAITDVA